MLQMREARTCSQCGQPIRNERLGVRLTPLKAAIVDKIKAAGAEGVSTTELIASDIWRDRKNVGADCVKSHVGQLNSAFTDNDSDWRIVSTRGRDPVWLLMKRRRKEKN